MLKSDFFVVAAVLRMSRRTAAVVRFIGRDDLVGQQNLVPQREENSIYRTELYFKPKIFNSNFSF
jgi:hypothetical protein